MDGNDGDDEEVGKRGGRVDRDQQGCEFSLFPSLHLDLDPAGWEGDPRPPPGPRA